MHDLGPGGLTCVTTLDGTVYAGTDHGRYRAAAPAEPLVVVGGAELDRGIINAISTFHGALFIEAINYPFDGIGRVHPSEDGGESWRTIGDTIPDRVGFYGDTLLVDDAYGRGVFEQDPTTGPFSAVEALGLRGYTAFTLDGNCRFVANSSAMFVGDGETWDTALYAPSRGTIANSTFASGDVVLAAGSATLQRSAYGGTWSDVLPFGTGFDEAFAGDVDVVHHISDRLCASTNLGATRLDTPTDVYFDDAVGSCGVTALPPLALRRRRVGPPRRRPRRPRRRRLLGPERLRRGPRDHELVRGRGRPVRRHRARRHPPVNRSGRELGPRAGRGGDPSGRAPRGDCRAHSRRPPRAQARRWAHTRAR